MTLNEAATILREAGIDDPLYEARTIFSHFDGTPVHKLIGQNPSSESPELISAVKRRAEREPLQYIIGECGFWRQTYKVTPAVLIPREDTEILVDYAQRHLPVGAKFLDLCTGSGCIAISTAASVKDSIAVAVDISADAIEVARENGAKNGVGERVSFVCADALCYLPDVNEKFHAILSNPPYIRNGVYKTLAPEIMHEPEAAFLGGEDGCDFYRALTERYLPYLVDGGFIGYEIGYDQSDEIAEIAEGNGCSVKIINDLSGNPRVAILTPRTR